MTDLLKSLMHTTLAVWRVLLHILAVGVGLFLTSVVPTIPLVLSRNCGRDGPPSDPPYCWGEEIQSANNGVLPTPCESWWYSPTTLINDLLDMGRAISKLGRLAQENPTLFEVLKRILSDHDLRLSQSGSQMDIRSEVSAVNPIADQQQQATASQVYHAALSNGQTLDDLLAAFEIKDGGTPLHTQHGMLKQPTETTGQELGILPQRSVTGSEMSRNGRTPHTNLAFAESSGMHESTKCRPDGRSMTWQYTDQSTRHRRIPSRFFGHVGIDNFGMQDRPAVKASLSDGLIITQGSKRALQGSLRSQSYEGKFLA